MAEITFNVKDLHCEKCVEKIRQALENLGGMEEVHFNLNEKLIKVAGETDPVEIQQSIQDAGYTPVLFKKENSHPQNS